MVKKGRAYSLKKKELIDDQVDDISVYGPSEGIGTWGLVPNKFFEDTYFDLPNNHAANFIPIIGIEFAA